MSRLRFAVTLSAALVVAGAIVAPGRATATSWVTKFTQNFTCVVPDSSWRVLATDGGIDISSQSGEEDVAFATGGWTGRPFTAGALAANSINFMSATSGDVLNPTITASGSPVKTSIGIVQRFNFTAIHRWVSGTGPVVGYMYVATSASSWQVSRVFSTRLQEKPDGPMLEFIRTHIGLSNRPPIGP